MKVTFVKEWLHMFIFSIMFIFKVLGQFFKVIFVMIIIKDIEYIEAQDKLLFSENGYNGKTLFTAEF